MNDQTLTTDLHEIAGVAAGIQRLAEAIQFAAEFGLRFSWFHDGPKVLVKTPDEVVMRVLGAQGASTWRYKPDERVNPGATAWEVDLARIGDFAKYIAICIRDGEQLGADTTTLHERLAEVSEQLAIEAAEELERLRLAAEERPPVEVVVASAA